MNSEDVESVIEILKKIEKKEVCFDDLEGVDFDDPFMSEIIYNVYNVHNCAGKHVCNEKKNVQVKIDVDSLFGFINEEKETKQEEKKENTKMEFRSAGTNKICSTEKKENFQPKKNLGMTRSNPQNTPKNDNTNKNNLPEINSVEPRLIELVMNEIMDASASMDWDDIAGLDLAKQTIKEVIIWPMLRPDIFNGVREPPKGLLLFGPPGTGKTMIGKCIAAQCKATFFSISASSLTSRWLGESEKLVRALFELAKYYQPSVIFIDEIDSLLKARTDDENESNRRLKTEFLVQLDGCRGCEQSGKANQLLVIGATNRPQDLDDAARRRLVKRLYISLPDSATRKVIIANLLKNMQHEVGMGEIEFIAERTEGYSAADVANLCKEAAYGPIREVSTDLSTIKLEQLPLINFGHFKNALNMVRSSVCMADLAQYEDFNKKFGTFN